MTQWNIYSGLQALNKKDRGILNGFQNEKRREPTAVAIGGIRA
jgi:uncharacterized protein YjaG (DUF416 family)